MILSSFGISFKIERYFGRALTYSLLSRYASHILIADLRASFFLSLSIFCLTISLFISFGGSSTIGVFSSMAHVFSSIVTIC